MRLCLFLMAGAHPYFHHINSKCNCQPAMQCAALVQVMGSFCPSHAVQHVAVTAPWLAANWRWHWMLVVLPSRTPYGEVGKQCLLDCS